jgi:hypothetical protein
LTASNFFQSHYKPVEDEESSLEPDFGTLIKYVAETTCEPSDMLYALMIYLTEQKYEVIEQYLPGIVENFIKQADW